MVDEGIRTRARPRLPRAARLVLLLGLWLLLGLFGCFRETHPTRGRALLLVEAGQLEAAEAILVEALKRRPELVGERRLLIRVLGLRGQLAGARSEAAALAGRLGWNDPRAWVDLGHALELSHDFEGALAMYDKAARLAPEDPLGPLTGGLRTARWGEVELAAPRLTEALRRDPRNSRAWHALGLVRSALGDLAGSERAYRSGILADPSAIENRLGLATLALRRGDAAGALVHFDAILAQRPRLGDAYLGRAWALSELGRYDAAEAALGRARELGGNALALERQSTLLRSRRAAAHGPHHPPNP